MGAVKQHFHEALCASQERASIYNLDVKNQAAWDAYRALIAAFPAWRTPEQERQVQEAHQLAENTKWALEREQFWSRYHG